MKTRAAFVCVLCLGCGETAGSGVSDATSPDATSPDATSPDAASPDAAVPVAVDLAAGVFLPGFRVAGAWHGGGRDGVCTRLGDTTTCTVPGVGRATLRGETPSGPAPQEHVQIEAVAEGGAAIEAVDAIADLALPDATAWISSGFQSWSQSGALALGEAVDGEVLDRALAAQGDHEVLRDGQALSWWYTAVGGGRSTVEVRVDGPTSRVAKGWFQASRSPVAPTRVHLRLAAGGDGDPTASAGFDLDWHEGAGSTLGEQDDRPRLPPLVGWNSWYDLYESVDETAVRANAGALAEIVSARPALASLHRSVVVDDGWQRGWGDWRANDKFPEGFGTLASDLAAQGFTLGLWMAPLLVAASDPVVAAHPDWFIEGQVFPHLVNGEMRVLDITHPDARAHLLDAMRALSAQGVGLFKLDFLFAGTWPGPRHTPMSAMAAYTLFWESVRAALPPNTVLVAVGAPPMPTLDFVDAWRVGNDIAVPNFGVAWAFLPNQLRSLAARQPFCTRGQCDADPVLLRVQAQPQVEFGAWLVAAAGGGLFLSDDLRALDPARVPWGLSEGVIAAAAGRGAVPESLFPADPPTALVSGFSDAVARKSRHAVPVVWSFFDGPRMAFNAGDEPLEVEGVSVPPRSVRALP